ncbi:MAG: hypothetical protein OFPI_07230 [Osedax symbiont Rs2]|nr:MAG: hypothetical protein OFPI_07230 [Osedax symbiont Rs2]
MLLDTALAIGIVLKRLRKEQGFQQADVASYIDASDRTLRNIEHGESGTKTRTVLKAASELGLQLYLGQKHGETAITVSCFTDIGRYVQSIRKVQNIRQEDLAAIVGIQHSVLGRLERGDDSVSIGTVFNVLKELGIELNNHKL